MMKSRPRLRRYATAAGSICGAESSMRIGLTTNRSAYGVSDEDVLVCHRFLERAHGEVAADFSQCHGGARAKLVVLATTEQAAIVEDVGEHRHALVSAQETIRLEERHLLGER